MQHFLFSDSFSSSDPMIKKQKFDHSKTIFLFLIHASQIFTIEIIKLSKVASLLISSNFCCISNFLIYGFKPHFYGRRKLPQQSWIIILNFDPNLTYLQLEFWIFDARISRVENLIISYDITKNFRDAWESYFGKGRMLKERQQSFYASNKRDCFQSID